MRSSDFWVSVASLTDEVCLSSAHVRLFASYFTTMMCFFISLSSARAMPFVLNSFVGVCLLALYAKQSPTFDPH